jgi:hypothetical protein
MQRGVVARHGGVAKGGETSKQVDGDAVTDSRIPEKSVNRGVMIKHQVLWDLVQTLGYQLMVAKVCHHRGTVVSKQHHRDQQQVGRVVQGVECKELGIDGFSSEIHHKRDHSLAFSCCF